MPSNVKDDVVPFRVALMLKRYKFGSNVAARYLDRPRGLVQSWMQSGESHALAEKRFALHAFEKKLKNVRRAITKENIYFLLAGRLIEKGLPAEYIGKHLGIPPSTVRAWKDGVSPKSVKKLFVDRRYLDREYSKLLAYLKYESTRENLPYYLSLRLVEEARKKVGPRRIGGKTISTILYNHLNLARPIPKETITCWVEGRRTPKAAFSVLRDNALIEDELSRLVDALTAEHMDYHVARMLYERYGWSYSRISRTLGIDKEKVRGWVKKDRGNPVAKSFRNLERVEEVAAQVVSENLSDSDLETVFSENDNESIVEPVPEAVSAYDQDLEEEILYHLSFFPSGIASPQAIKSILIDNKEASINDIIIVLESSPNISRKNGRWKLKG